MSCQRSQSTASLVSSESSGIVEWASAQWSKMRGWRFSPKRSSSQRAASSARTGFSDAACFSNLSGGVTHFRRPSSSSACSDRSLTRSSPALRKASNSDPVTAPACGSRKRRVRPISTAVPPARTSLRSSCKRLKSLLPANTPAISHGCRTSFASIPPCPASQASATSSASRLLIRPRSRSLSSSRTCSGVLMLRAWSSPPPPYRSTSRPPACSRLFFDFSIFCCRSNPWNRVLSSAVSIRRSSADRSPPFEIEVQSSEIVEDRLRGVLRRATGLRTRLQRPHRRARRRLRREQDFAGDP